MNPKHALALCIAAQSLSLAAPSLARAQFRLDAPERVNAPAQPAHVGPPPQGRFQVSVASHLTWQLDPRWDAVRGPSVISGPELNVSANVAGHATRWVLAAEVGYRNGSFESSTLGSVGTGGGIHALYGGASVRFVPTHWFQPYARLTAGAGYTDLRLVPQGQPALRGGGWGFVGSGGLGAMISTGPFTDDPRFSRFELAAGVEGGVIAGNSTSIALAPEAPPNETEAARANRLEQRSVSLGSVAPSAGYLRIWFGMRF